MKAHHKRIAAYIGVLAITFFVFVQETNAATLKISPDTGVYTVGGTFNATVVVNTQGKPINAADAQITFNPKELAVQSVSRGASIFNLWTQEPTFSNSAGSISFSGGSPSGYTGTNGTVMTIVFRPLAAGSPKVTFKSASVLAADGLGTNVLTGMTGASYSIAAKSEIPPPEYIPPPNTPMAPKVTSPTHPDEDNWYRETTARLEWAIPSDIIAVRTLLDTSEISVPTIVYEPPVGEKSVEELPQGISYFHVQFKNADGWGRVTHFRLAVDTEPPSDFVITESTEQEQNNPSRTLIFTAKDTSPITLYKIQIDGGEPIEYKDTEQSQRYALPVLPSGHHTIVVEAFDAAGNSRVASYAFDISAFEAPLITEYPVRISPGVVPVIRGTTRASADVSITFTKTNGESETVLTKADASGSFTAITDAGLTVGVYDVTAIATDEYGATSMTSEKHRIVVEEPGYMRIGSFVVSVLSVVVPLIALLILSIFGTWFLWHRLSRWKRTIAFETREAEETLKRELDEAFVNLHSKVTELKESRKGKLTNAEASLIEQIETDLADVRTKVRKEIADIENIVQ